MAIKVLAENDIESNYGSDFDEDGEAQLQQLLDSIEACTTESPLLVDLQHDARSTLAQFPAFPDSQCYKTISSPKRRIYGDTRTAAQVELDKVDPGSGSFPHDESPGRIQWEVDDLKQQRPDDQRSPLDRFRTAPKKPFSVTDFVSPAWCELQYWYHLVNHGRVKQTPAMKRGSELHKILEDQVHQTVPVDVQTKEDTWGLRIWNVIQGLRTLRVTGMTREMEIWGTLDGQVVNGIIDELSFTCTDPELEESIWKFERPRATQVPILAHQLAIEQFLGPSHANDPENEMLVAARPPKVDHKVYLTDVKTRGSRILPNKIAMRPTEIQLMLYRRLLVDMACNSVNSSIIFARYNLKPAEKFSESLISQLSSIDFNFHSYATKESQTPLESNTGAAIELHTHNSLSELWSLMLSEFHKTMPYGAESISTVLRAEFRSSMDGSIIGVKTFPYRHEEITDHVADEMRWWKGEREARGVDVEEAFKCRTCPFAEDCTWRLSKVEDAVSLSRKKLSARRSEQKEQGTGRY